MFVHCQQDKHCRIQSENARVQKPLALNRFLVSQFEIFVSSFSSYWVIALFTRVILRVTVYYFCHVRIRSSHQEVFGKKDGLRNFAKFTGKHHCYSLFFKNKALAQMFSYEFCKISKNNFSYRIPSVTASGVSE